MSMTPFRNPSPLLNPRSVAVVGASNRPGSAGRPALENLRHLGYEGPVQVVHPRHDEVLGFPCYPDLSSLPRPVDSVVVLLGADKVLPVLEKAVETRVEAAWVLASGFGEAGEAILPPFSPIANPLDARGSGDLEATYPACVGVVSHEVEQSLAVVKAAVEATSETRKPVLLFSNLCAGFNPQVVEAAQAVGYPVVLKILSPDIHHKTEIGGVRVGLGDEAEVRLAFRQAMAAARERHPGADLQGVLIQEMIGDDAVEVIVGVLKDADFGPVIVFGLGGILVELFEDPSLRLPPLSRRDAREMIEETQAARLLAGFRERRPADVEALVDVLVRVSQLAVDLKGQIAALDINPLMVLPQG